ncbi:MAG TPA: nucleotidyl transferase AbiEii/AbiGii toxin family protein [Polyangia bacterium]|jgi:Domain of unknown function (DUF1814).|nr:nucleotidyl transferase AbiEii/AbiGii toxin family protein [Polyangia bacterium]
MKDHLLQTVASLDPDKRIGPAREYVQMYILRLLHSAEAYRHMAFLGGTALRVLYDLPRFSDGLDFSVVPARPSTKAEAKPLDIEWLCKRLADDLHKAGYDVQVKQRVGRIVANAFFRFQGLPRDLGWSRDPRLGLIVKVEIDRKPPEGAGIETTLVQRPFPIALRHYDRPSLFAGKLHAILCRPYTKGRDWFDLAWYLTAQRGLQPNLGLLANALKQTRTSIDASKWREAVRARLRSLKWAEVTSDLRGFLQRPDDLDQIRPELIEKALLSSP